MLHAPLFPDASFEIGVHMVVYSPIMMGAMRYADGTELSLGTQGTDRIVPPPGKQQGSSGPDEVGGEHLIL